MSLPTYLKFWDRPAPDGCRCGHVTRAHEHYRRGSDCALCPCTRFRGAPPMVVPAGPTLEVRGERRHAA